MIRDFWILINEKYQRNKTVIWFIVAIVVLFILVMRNIDKVSNTARGSGESSTTSGSVSNNEKISEIINETEDDYGKIQEKTKDIIMSKVDHINLFVQLCNSGKVDTAYEYLSDACKEALYPTKQSFIDNYYSVIFKISKEFEITEVKNDTYKVSYTNDLISTGGNGSNEGEMIDYITYDRSGKLGISNFIESKEVKITSIAPYFTFYVDKKQTYMDHVVYNIRVKNNTKADIYINDEDDNNLYIEAENGGIYKVDTSNLFDSDYLVPAGKEKSLELTFYINYAKDSDATSLCLGNIIIVNKEYYDTTTEVKNPRTGEMEYAKVKTNYPEKYSWTIKFE